MTVLELIRSATGYFAKCGIDNPRLTAEHLLASVLGMRRLDLYLCYDRPVTEAERAPLRELARRRVSGEPLQHLLGEWDFYGRPYRVDRRALVPRPETEILVERVLETLPEDRSLRVADVGTGSGVIALTLALERPAWHVEGFDISEEALGLARENAALHGVGEAVAFSACDLLPEAGAARWDAVAANLPYIPSREIASLSEEVRHDPAIAMDGGEDGLDCIRRIAADAPPKLAVGGKIFLEFGAGQDDAVAAILRAAGFCDIRITPDLSGIPRIAEASFF